MQGRADLRGDAHHLPGLPEGVPDPGRHSRDADRRGGALGPDEITAVILAGGQGTRLRPLTLGTPKPIVPLLNVPFLAYQLALLRRYGITDVVLSCSYLVDEVRRAMGDGAAHGVRLSYAVETDPLGTAGGVRNAVDLVRALVVVLNGDILADLDLGAMLRFHRERGARATLYLTRVPDPTQYGLVELDSDGAIRAFVEKPAPDRVTTDTVNAGVYALDRSVVTAIPTGRAVSIERETFPGLLRDRVPFFGWVSGSYWLDIGSPAKYRQGRGARGGLRGGSRGADRGRHRVGRRHGGPGCGPARLHRGLRGAYRRRGRPRARRRSRRGRLRPRSGPALGPDRAVRRRARPQGGRTAWYS